MQVREMARTYSGKMFLAKAANKSPRQQRELLIRATVICEQSLLYCWRPRAANFTLECSNLVELKLPEEDGHDDKEVEHG